MKAQAALTLLTAVAAGVCVTALVVAHTSEASCDASTRDNAMLALWLSGGALAWAVLLTSATLRRPYWWVAFGAGVGCLVLELFSLGGLVAFCF